MQPRSLRLVLSSRSPRPVSLSKALMELGVVSPAEARVTAERELAASPRCGCCLNPRIHLTRFVGSTLFTDDDPYELWLSIPSDERPQWTPRIIAACIVLHGRPRFDLYAHA